MGDVIYADFGGVWYPGDGAVEPEDDPNPEEGENDLDHQRCIDDAECFLDLLEPLDMDTDLDNAP